MANATTNGSQPSSSQGAAVDQANVRVLGQFIKDLSFENPNVGRVQIEPNEQPAIRVEVNVNAKPVGPNLFESVVEFKSQCSVKSGVLYDLELEYGAVVQVENVPEASLEPFLLINCPALIFPFVRRLVADITREGGFPPLLLDPIDFTNLYMQRRQQAAEGAGATS